MTKRVAFVGSAGIPNRYGGFEAFLEHCAPRLAAECVVTVTCDSRLYDDRAALFAGVRRRFIGVPANGAWSVVHDLLAFARVFQEADYIVVLGVSGGAWFPIFRLACDATGKRVLVNIDGVEWRRAKFSAGRRVLLRLFDALAQSCAHRVIYDNAALLRYVLPWCRPKAVEIAYSGDHVLRCEGVRPDPSSALTICRVEPENNIEMMVEGFISSNLRRYTIVGNWDKSQYGRDLRRKWNHEPRLELLDPIYDSVALARLRESCGIYLHGHSVGGTNPSLVEMLYYDCRLLCFDCDFNRMTAGDCADYFDASQELAKRLGETSGADSSSRDARRGAYTGAGIAAAYLSLLIGGTP